MCVVKSSQCGDEPSGSGATELVKVILVSNDSFLKRKHILVQTAFGMRITMEYD
jgi:hypothetical protein